MFSVAAVREGEGGEGSRGPSSNGTTHCKVPLSPVNPSATIDGESSTVVISWKSPLSFWVQLFKEKEDGSVEILLILIMKARALPLRKSPHHSVPISLSIFLGESSLETSIREEKVDQKIPDTDHETRTDQAIPVYDNVQQPAPYL
ncbi:hypothetical protein BSL78_09775 [Apostichopus japonicus]|uniref:Uncharacterized protein n=1 Tax=Stichopus japonicus TaxID=307972 RepID=A0A2G8KZD4_STIJA|nr:hypothetical protein BSL78_09775 [Apostichopus japonicus]